MLVQFPGEKQLQPLTMLCNTGPGEVFSNVRANLERGYVKFKEEKAHDRIAVICGSGPSLADTLENIRAMQRRGAFVLGLNGAARYLAGNGIVCDALAVVDPRQENVEFVTEPWAPEAWLASQVHPDVTAAAEQTGMAVILWHPGVPGLKEHVPASDCLRMGGAMTIGLCAVSCAYVAGYREIHLFGYDSSHREDKSHAFDQPMNADEETMTCTVDNRQFTCSTVMAAQASLFLEFTNVLLKDGVELHVHGDGLIPTLWRHKQRMRAQRVLTAVYDLGVSPPTYDFFSFLSEAERCRRERNYDHLDVVFQPGPMHGFRADDLPPDAIEREAMLHRICVAGAKLCPSVRNIKVFRQRESLAGDVFPEGWQQDVPLSNYGFRYAINGHKCLRATDAARRDIARRFPEPYATITLRDAEYWPERNSNRGACLEAAKWFVRHAIREVVIPDTHGENLAGASSFTEAAWDIDLRMALYEGALINIGVAQGPLCGLLLHSSAPYILFRPVAPGSNASTSEYFEAHGVLGKDWSDNGTVIWQDDTTEVMTQALEEWWKRCGLASPERAAG